MIMEIFKFLPFSIHVTLQQRRILNCFIEIVSRKEILWDRGGGKDVADAANDSELHVQDLMLFQKEYKYKLNEKATPYSETKN